MAVKKKYHKKIEEGLEYIFKTETLKGDQKDKRGSVDFLAARITEPLVKQQIIQLANLCKEIPVSVTLKSSGSEVFIEFW